MSKDIPWVQTYPYLPEGFNAPDDVPGPLPDGITEAELQTLLDAGATFETSFDGPDPFAFPSTMVIRIGNKVFMTKFQTVTLSDIITSKGEIWNELSEATRKLLRAALDDLVAFSHDGKSA